MGVAKSFQGMGLRHILRDRAEVSDSKFLLLWRACLIVVGNWVFWQRQLSQSLYWGGLFV